MRMIELEYNNRLPDITWISKWSRDIWERNYGPMKETKRRQIERDKREDLERKQAIEKHAKTKNTAIDRKRRLVKKNKQIIAADQRSHNALNANRLGKTHGPKEKDGFYVPGTKEFNDLKIKYGFLVNNKSVYVDGDTHLMICKTRKSKHERLSAASMCNQSLQHFLKKSNELVKFLNIDNS